MVIHGSTSQTAAMGHIKNALRHLMPSEEEPSARVLKWEAIYKYMMEQEVHLSPHAWLEILEDKDIGPAVENRDERYEALVKSMPHMNGHPMRVDSDTFQPRLYIDGEWVELEAVKDPEPELETLHEEYQHMMTVLNEADEKFAKAEAVMEEVEASMAEINDLNYDDAMSVVGDSK